MTGYSPLAKDFKNLLKIDSGERGATFLICSGVSWDSKAGFVECTIKLKICKHILMNTATGLTVAI